MLCTHAVLCCATQVGQGRPHIFCDMRIVDDRGRELPRDGQAVGNLQVGSGHTYVTHPAPSLSPTYFSCLLRIIVSNSDECFLAVVFAYLCVYFAQQH